jgi:hypothetical protein
LEVEASDYAIGAVLMQRDDKNILHPVAFFSKTMNEAQRNYNVYNQELLGLRETLKTWRQYMHQARYKVKYTPSTPIYCSGRIQENTIEEWCDGMQN